MKGIWDERSKTWILPSGTVAQGRRPMFKPFTKAERAAQLAAFADKVYAASEPSDPTGKPILDALINASESFADLNAEQQ